MSKHSIEIKVTFRAGHRLISPYVGNCNNVHGEGYTVVLFFQEVHLNECGMVIDFKQVKKYVKDWVDNNLDHSYLCHKDDHIISMFRQEGFKLFVMDDNPTAENISKLIFDNIKSRYSSLYKVGVWESFDDSIAWYEE